MTLITVRHGGGVVERCDARCHNSKEPKCTCVCGGRFHGKGSETQVLFEAIKEHTAELVLKPEIQESDTSLLLYLSGLSAPPDSWLKSQSLFPLENQHGESVEAKA